MVFVSAKGMVVVSPEFHLKTMLIQIALSYKTEYKNHR